MSQNPSLTYLQTALSTTLGLQLLRVLLPSFVQFLREAVGLESLELAPLAFGLFSLSLLAGPIYNLIGGEKSLKLAVGGLALFKFAEQLSSSAMLDFIFSAGGVILFTWFIPFSFSQTRTRIRGGTFHFGVGLLLGLAFDTGLHIAGGTLNISWQRGILPILTVLILGLVSLWTLRAQSGEKSASFKEARSWKVSLPFIAIGPWLFLELQIFQNVARTAAVTGWSLPAAGLLVVLGNAIRIWMSATFVRHSNNITLYTILFSLLLIITLLFPNMTGPMAAVIILTGLLCGAMLFMVIVSVQETNQALLGIKRIAITNGFAQLLFVLLVFLYYASYDIPLGLRSYSVLPIAGILFAFLSVFHTRNLKQSNPLYQIGVIPPLASTIMLLFPIYLFSQWNTPSAVTPITEKNNVRIMNYNVHMGFNTDGKLDIETIAKTIEKSGAEIIGLQEIPRGWLTTGSLDMLSWLSQRLKMNYVSGPTADLQWGNAILSRYPIRQASIQPLPPDHILIRRGYILAQINIGRNLLTIITTHLHHPENGTEIRLTQIPVLLKAWGGAPRTLIMGDLNATPKSPEINLIRQAGLLDSTSTLVSTSNFTFPSNNPQKQIDYIWVTPDILPIDFKIPKSTASDHLPIVVTIELK